MEMVKIKIIIMIIIIYIIIYRRFLNHIIKGKADVIAFDDLGVNIIYGKDRISFEQKGGSLMKINNDFNPTQGYNNYN